MPQRLFTLMLVGVLFASTPAWGQATSAALRGALKRALPLLERASAGAADERECFTCHNQALPVLALSAARRHGFAIDGDNYERQLKHTFAHLDRSKDRYLEGKGTGGKADTAGYALWTLDAGDWKPDETTDAVAEYLLLWQAEDEHWTCTSNRPPSEASDFTTTYLALRGLNDFGTPAQQDRISTRTFAARDWLLATPAEDHEDRVFRLWGLQLSGADDEAVATAADELLAHQRQDGGWRQLDSLQSDAYATGTALVVLERTGVLNSDDADFQRGVDYLLSTQLEDGSWHVVSRSKPFQKYFESGFPHGEDQFISAAASSWAVMALLCPLQEVSATPEAGGE